MTQLQIMLSMYLAVAGYMAGANCMSSKNPYLKAFGVTTHTLSLGLALWSLYFNK